MENRRRSIDNIFILVLAGIFLLTSVALVVLGADIYKKTASANQDAYQIRTASLYFDQKIHSADASGAVELSSLESGQQALVLKEGDYETWIFLAGGQLREATVRIGTTVTESFGQPVLELDSLEFSPLKNDLLRITAVSPQGKTSQVDIFLRTSEMEVAP